MHELPYTLTHTYTDTDCVASACCCMLPEWAHGMNDVYMCCVGMCLQDFERNWYPKPYAYF